MAKQLLHLVFGGELKDPGGVGFADLGALAIVGIHPDYRTAHQAWRSAAQRSVDDAHVRYFIVHLHRCSTRTRTRPEVCTASNSRLPWGAASRRAEP